MIACKCDLAYPVKDVDFAVGDRCCGFRHRSPHVPGQHLHSIEGGQIADEVLGNPPQPLLVHKREAEEVGIGLTVAALPPRVPCNDEAVARNVERVKTWLEGLALNGVELRVNQNPTLLCGVPVLGNPMIFDFPGLQ